MRFVFTRVSWRHEPEPPPEKIRGPVSTKGARIDSITAFEGGVRGKLVVGPPNETSHFIRVGRAANFSSALSPPIRKSMPLDDYLYVLTCSRHWMATQRHPPPERSLFPMSLVIPCCRVTACIQQHPIPLGVGEQMYRNSDRSLFPCSVCRHLHGHILAS